MATRENEMKWKRIIMMMIKMKFFYFENWNTQTQEKEEEEIYPRKHCLFVICEHFFFWLPSKTFFDDQDTLTQLNFSSFFFSFWKCTLFFYLENLHTEFYIHSNNTQTSSKWQKKLNSNHRLHSHWTFRYLTTTTTWDIERERTMKTIIMIIINPGVGIKS